MRILHLLALAARMHWASPRDVLMAVAGFALASSVLTLLLAIPSGLEKAAASTGRPDVALALSAGAFDEATSTLSAQHLQLLGSLPAVARDEHGAPLIAPHLIGRTTITVNGRNRPIQVRGVDPMTWKVMELEGERLARLVTGSRGLLIGSWAVTPPSSHPVRVRAGQWHVAGRADHDGSLWDSEYWADLSTLQADYQSPSQFSVALIRLNAATDLPALREAVRENPRLSGIRIVRQSDYYQLHTQWLAELIRSVSLVIAATLGAAAALTIGNALSTSFLGRRRYAATLRAMGFSSRTLALAAWMEVQIIGALTCCAVLLLVRVTLDGHTFAAASEGHQVLAQLDVGVGAAAVSLVYTLLLATAASVVPIWTLSFGILVDALGADR